ncbi:hypothetical protein PHMEG_0007999 [Phytophthora megakarya]|uniref:Uncharacterized protein n=1 Tax=Phytophthora megakarya TaxID=4795 RepID=A0A225WJT6_9STRA|nr:hypothetical protein PHMEG_0007999 [Phytophthora megakarya]
MEKAVPDENGASRCVFKEEAIGSEVVIQEKLSSRMNGWSKPLGPSRRYPDDRTLRDLMKTDTPCAGKVVLLAGDFHQILHVIP